MPKLRRPNKGWIQRRTAAVIFGVGIFGPPPRTIPQRGVLWDMLRTVDARLREAPPELLDGDTYRLLLGEDDPELASTKRPRLPMGNAARVAE